MAEWVFTVSELSELIRGIVSQEELLQNIQVRGEISGLRRAASGHVYFTLKDMGAQLQCVYFKQDQLGVSLRLADGLQVVISGRAAFYMAGGQLNLYVKGVKTYGAGSLHLMLERLKARLEEEGLFDSAHKRALPPLPGAVGIVTSGQGAVLHDILRILNRRAPKVDVYLVPVRVQGEDAGLEIARGIERLNRHGRSDVIIVGRGGGSFEDLYEFNSEEVVRAVYNSAIPVVSAVGHETDFTLCDFAADLRAATPSEAAELISAGWLEVEGRLDALEDTLDRRALQWMEGQDAHLRALQRALSARNPKERLAADAIRTDMLSMRLEGAARRAVENKAGRLATLTAHIQAYNPETTLRLGYALVYDHGRKRFITRAAQATPGGDVDIRMADGVLRAHLEEK